MTNPFAITNAPPEPETPPGAEVVEAPGCGVCGTEVVALGVPHPATSPIRTIGDINHMRFIAVQIILLPIIAQAHCSQYDMSSVAGI